MRLMNRIATQWMALVMILALVTLPACSKQTTQRAGQGAATGAVVGAVGGMVSALVFGGNAADAAARGAVWGASTGAAAGAMSGAMAESNKKAQQTDELKALRTKLGDDAFSGLEALVQCKHEVAQGYGRTAAGSDNPDHALAGLWLQVLAYADSRQEEKARAFFPDLVSKDSKISSASQAETEMRDALQKLMDIRQQYNLPRVCG